MLSWPQPWCPGCRIQRRGDRWLLRDQTVMCVLSVCSTHVCTHWQGTQSSLCPYTYMQTHTCISTNTCTSTPSHQYTQVHAYVLTHTFRTQRPPTHLCLACTFTDMYRHHCTCVFPSLTCTHTPPPEPCGMMSEILSVAFLFGIKRERAKQLTSAFLKRPHTQKKCSLPLHPGPATLGVYVLPTCLSDCTAHVI